MTDYEKSVIRNIIYAVETGGQVYGNKDYADFTEAYTNSSTEYAITIGAGQWYGIEAKTLLDRIKQADPSLFASLDTAGVRADLDASDWSNYRISKTSAKAQCIVRIIDTSVGHRCQDQLIEEQMENFINRAASLGVTDMDAKMMCANFEHQGGSGAVPRILAKCQQPYTLDNLYAACKTDTGNQVGVYRSRQAMVYNALKKYISNYVVTPEAAIEAAITIAKKEVGYFEKGYGDNLDNFAPGSIYDNYTKYWRDIDSSLQGQPWCAAFVTWVFEKAFGRSAAATLLKHYPYIYVPTLANLFTRYANPQVGDVVMYYSTSKGFYHTGLVIAVNGDNFTAIEGNTNDGSGVIDEGIGVFIRERVNSRLPGTKFARPDYSIITSINDGGSGENPYPVDTFKPTGTATCTGEGVNVRESPNGTVIGALSKGDRFEVDGYKSGVWVHIKAAGIGVGYMHEDYVSYDGGSSSWTATGTATCGGDSVYVRAAPGGTVIGMLDKGNRFEVDGTKSGVWVHIKVAGIGIGYMHEDYVIYDGSSSSWNRTGTGYCTGDEVRVRATPNGTVIGYLNKGNMFEVDGTRSGVWIHIKAEGIGIGYMHQDYVSSSGSSGGAGSAAGIAQSTLNSRYNAGLSVDGIWGPASQEAYVCAIQKALNSVYGSGLVADGIWGSNTASACAAHPLSQGDNNSYVGVLQIGLYAHGITLTNGIDNDFGPSTEQGVRSFQSMCGLDVDGIAGGNTFEQLANN